MPCGQGLPFPLDPDRSLIVVIFLKIFIYLFDGIRPKLQRSGSVVAMRGLCCPAVCGILVP